MAQTPLTGTAYVTPADVILRYDVRTIGELLVDTDLGARLQSAEIVVSPAMLAFCLEASGELESALTKGHRQNPDDIAAIVADPTKNAAQYTIGLLSALVMARCLGRRPDRFPTPDSVKDARQFMELLSTGERILPTNEAADAGVKVPPILLPINNFPLITEKGRRYFGDIHRPQFG